MATNVPSATLGPAGFIAPTESQILAGVFADLQRAFNGNLSTNLETPQGQLATSYTATLGAAFDLYNLYVAQVDPAYSDGRMQDAIARIYYLTRLPATPTVVETTISGAAGTMIPVGSLAVATDGTIYSALSAVTIPGSGSVDTPFAALTLGPIACPAGSLTQIYRQLPGWDSITNTTDGTLGRDIETRQSFEARRAASVAINATGILPAIRGSVLAVPGVLDAFVTENSTTSATTINGVIVPANSVYVAVQGGVDLDVATAIWTKKPPGCGYAGNTTVTVADSNAGYVTPPTYAVSFTRPAALPVAFTAQISSRTDVPADATAQVTAAISAQFGSEAHIGQPLYASSFICALGALGAWARLVSIKVNGGDVVTVTAAQFPALSTVSVALV